jgi:hypothetical protein
VKLLLGLLTVVAISACAHVSPVGSLRLQSLAGVYDGREVIDTEERLTLSADGTFSYDFVPLGEGGASYGGRWRVEKNAVILVAKLESGEDEEFPLVLEFYKGIPRLTYTWESQRRQRATMLIPNVFVRLKRPNQSPEPKALLGATRA